MAILTRPRTPPPDEENPYWMSFSDLMSGLLIIFILAAIALIIELTEKTAQYDEVLKQVKEAEKARRSIVEEVKNKLTAQGISIIINDSASVIRIPESSLKFEQGKADIPEDDVTQHVVRTTGQVLFQALVDDPRTKYLDTVFVEGHTDCTPYRGWKFDDNWDLSTKRSNALWRFWSEGVAYTKDGLPDTRTLADLTSGSGSPLFSVSGYGETRPLPNTRPNGLCAGDQPELLGQNRRIDLRFTIRAPSQAFLEDELKGIQSAASAEGNP